MSSREEQVELRCLSSVHKLFMRWFFRWRGEGDTATSLETVATRGGSHSVVGAVLWFRGVVKGRVAGGTVVAVVVALATAVFEGVPHGCGFADTNF